MRGRVWRGRTGVIHALSKQANQWPPMSPNLAFIGWSRPPPQGELEPISRGIQLEGTRVSIYGTWPRGKPGPRKTLRALCWHRSPQRRLSGVNFSANPGRTRLRLLRDEGGSVRETGEEFPSSEASMQVSIQVIESFPG